MTTTTDQIFRVFYSNHFIEVRHFDIVAPTARKAISMGGKHLKKLDPKVVRQGATDNGWIPQDHDPITVEQLGGRGPEYPPHAMVETSTKGVYACAGFGDNEGEGCCYGINGTHVPVYQFNEKRQRFLLQAARFAREMGDVFAGEKLTPDEFKLIEKSLTPA